MKRFCALFLPEVSYLQSRFDLLSNRQFKDLLPAAGREEIPEHVGSSTDSAERSPGRRKHFLWSLCDVCLGGRRRADDRADIYKLQRQDLTESCKNRGLDYGLSAAVKRTE